jgi:hypothetical protein
MVRNSVCNDACNWFGCSHDGGDCSVDHVWRHRLPDVPDALAGARSSSETEVRVRIQMRSLSVIVADDSGRTYVDTASIAYDAVWDDERLLDPTINPVANVVMTELSATREDVSAAIGGAKLADMRHFHIPMPILLPQFSGVQLAEWSLTAVESCFNVNTSDPLIHACSSSQGGHSSGQTPGDSGGGPLPGGQNDDGDDEEPIHRQEFATVYWGLDDLPPSDGMTTTTIEQLEGDAKLVPNAHLRLEVKVENVRIEQEDMDYFFYPFDAQMLMLRIKLPSGFNNTNCGTDELWGDDMEETYKDMMSSADAYELNGDTAISSHLIVIARGDGTVTSECAIGISVIRKWPRFFLRRVIPNMLVVFGGLMALWLNPMAPPLVGGRCGLLVTATLLVSNKLDKETDVEDVCTLRNQHSPSSEHSLHSSVGWHPCLAFIRL